MTNVVPVFVDGHVLFPGLDRHVYIVSDVIKLFHVGGSGDQLCRRQSGLLRTTFCQRIHSFGNVVKQFLELLAIFPDVRCKLNLLDIEEVLDGEPS